ncbi:hypothetical protein NKR23_g804 [Pleurostoma richardsiae]|uniref:Carboxymuconolactone decarboxylase-like domain-containing protein n=1 Tax=Pleurostoma richardsiae TaxID=41990 RepID=A0AA38S4D0_9PEZI|nr:hypothetical protein NKR23_g804 [Pleurostoma richardsiae]
MSLVSLSETFRDEEKNSDVRTAKWYIIAASALAAAGGGPAVVDLYQLAIKGVTLDEEKTIQRRIKEAILKTSILYGVPKSLQALLPLFSILPDDRIDHTGPRCESLHSKEAAILREQKGREYFDTIWGLEAAQFHRDRNFKYQPDLYLLNLKFVYEWYLSEDTILSSTETQMCNAAALICSGNPVQALWHTRGILRHGGGIEQARLSQYIGLEIARLYDCKIGDIVRADDIEVDVKSPE